MIKEVNKELPADPKSDSPVEKDLRYAAIYARTQAHRIPRLTLRQLEKAIRDLEAIRQSKNSFSDETIITYQIPPEAKPKTDNIIPKTDKNGRQIDPMAYTSLVLRTDGHGTINGENQLAMLVKNGLTYRKLLQMLEIKPKEAYQIWTWEKISPAILDDSIAHGFTDRLSFIKSGMLVRYDAKLPQSYHKVIINRYPSAMACEKIGQAYAYKDASRLDPAIFPDKEETKPAKGHDQTYWNVQIGDELTKDIDIDSYKDYQVKTDIKFILGAHKSQAKEPPLRVRMRFEARDRQRNIEVMFTKKVEKVEVKINQEDSQTFIIKDGQVHTYHRLDLARPLKKADIIRLTATSKNESRTMTYQVVR